MGKLLAICISEKKGTLKREVDFVRLIEEYGLENDAHAGKWHRQVSLLSAEKINKFREKMWVEYGAFGENLVVEGYDLSKIPVGSRFQIGDAELELTQIGKECHSDCIIRQTTGDCIMPREGVFARVIKPGEVKVGDEVFLLAPVRQDLFRTAVITVSDKGSRGKREDLSGPAICEMLEGRGYKIEEKMIVSDGIEPLRSELINLCDRRMMDLILTTGGTGFAPRDLTPEATMLVCERNAPGIAEAIRAYSLSITPRAMLSRAVSVIRKNTLIINLPGSPKAVRESLEYILPSLEHGLKLLKGLDGDCAR